MEFSELNTFKPSRYWSDKGFKGTVVNQGLRTYFRKNLKYLLKQCEISDRNILRKTILKYPHKGWGCKDDLKLLI